LVKQSAKSWNCRARNDAEELKRAKAKINGQKKTRGAIGSLGSVHKKARGHPRADGGIFEGM
jgi:hypothetical protein